MAQSQSFSAEEERKIQEMLADLKRQAREQQLQEEAHWRFRNEHKEPNSGKKR